VKLSPVKAIKKFCFECAGSVIGRKDCEITNCPLYPYRLGKNPNRNGVGGRKPSKTLRKLSKPLLKL